MDDAVYQAIRREYNSRLNAVTRDEERLNELNAQAAGLRQAIITGKVALSQLETYAIGHGWDIKKFGGVS
jgi:hypothetical protein